MKTLAIIAGLTAFAGLSQARLPGSDDGRDALFAGFVNPPAEARPFVRWWWNGNHITAAELTRQLDILHAAGIGGIEINPIEMPEEAKQIGSRPVTWLSPEWNRLVVHAAEEARKRGMTTDLIVGSGWPFGGEFVAEDDMLQRVITHTIPCPAGTRFQASREQLVEMAMKAQSRPEPVTPVRNEFLFVSLVPVDAKGTAAVMDLSGAWTADGQLSFEAPPEKNDLVYGILQRGHRHVMFGALGAAGPVMDHYDKKVTRAYLNRLARIAEDTGVPLSRSVRALFCDSIELAGANWTDGFAETFHQAYGYRLEPYYPFVFYDPHLGYPEERGDSRFADEIMRVRYDYNKLLVQTFLDNFVRPFHDFCHENGLLSRYQAYGTPFLPGIMEGNLIPDIPESNNWLYSSDMQSAAWTWNQPHGYMIWNLYAASGGHLTGRRIISCEAMTNVKGVFQTSLEEIKRHDDMNFISGMNHSILHGYNYSPEAVGFPGWIRFGTYFSEQNTWWPHFPRWVEYNARVSHVLQRSEPVREIAVLAPAGDIWSRKGLSRIPFHIEPWYCHRLWEPLSQAGSSCDYINEEVIQQGRKSDAALHFGPMSYRTLVLCSVKSLQPASAEALRDFVRAGGQLILVDGVPQRSLSRGDGAEGDLKVRRVFSDLLRSFPKRCRITEPPAAQDDLLPWTKRLLDGLVRDEHLSIDKPDRNVYQIHQKDENRDIFFFTNSHRTQDASLLVHFPTGSKTPWVWDPETGARSVFPHSNSKRGLHIDLRSLHSLLLVFEPEDSNDADGAPVPASKPGSMVARVEGPWTATFAPAPGEKFERIFERLHEFGTSTDPQLGTFAGTVTYATTFDSDGSGAWIELPEVNNGITDVILNGTGVGVNWYGKPLFRIDGILKRGRNQLEIKCTTLLSNYCRSLSGNATAALWTKGYKSLPAGLDGEVLILGGK